MLMAAGAAVTVQYNRSNWPDDCDKSTVYLEETNSL